LEQYDKIINSCVRLLKKDRFCCFVVSNFRNFETGFYYSLVADTVKVFQNAGCDLYNDIVLVTSLGSAPFRARKPFETSRKVARIHQNVLVFFKGNINEIHNNGIIDNIETQPNFGKFTPVPKRKSKLTTWSTYISKKKLVAENENKNEQDFDNDVFEEKKFETNFPLPSNKNQQQQKQKDEEKQKHKKNCDRKKQ